MTSYTTLPSNSYVGLGSQGNLLHSANFGTYDTGVGSITSHPFQYQTTNYSTHHQQPSYADEFLRTAYANETHATEQPQQHLADRSVHQSSHHQDPSLNDYRYENDRSTMPNNHDGNHPPHRTHPDNHPHQTSHPDTTHHHRSPPAEHQHHHHPPPAEHQYHHPPPAEHQHHHHPPPAEHQYHHPPPAEHQHHPPPPTNHVRSEHDASTHPSPPKHQQRHPSPGGKHHSQPNQVRSDHQTSKQPPAVHRRSPSNSPKDPPSATTAKPHPPPSERKTTKSTQMRAAAIKQKEETREQQRKNGNFPGATKKSTPPKTQAKQKSVPPSPSDDDRSEKPKSKRNKKQSNSLPKQHKSRRNDYHTEDNNSSADEDRHDEHPRSKSKKRTAFSDSRHEKYPSLPPVRRGRGPPFYDPAYDYPYPPPRGRYPHYDDYPPYGPYPYPGRHDYRHRHLYDDAYDGPPYIAGYHDPYDGFFDYERRKGKSRTKVRKDKKEPTTDHEDRDAVTANETERDDDAKSVQSKKTKSHKKSSKDDNENEHDEHVRQHWPHNYHDAPYYDEHDALEIWRQERNDYLKKKFKPTIHDVLYSQQWMKSDSYLENQRRRALRDTQGYYFPYKKYTLKDYKDLQKHEEQYNPYAAVPEPTLDRKERAKKRQEYASHVERQPADTFGGQQRTPRDMPPRKPWHLTLGEPNNPDKLSKRERALEYAKVQVVKHRPQKAPKNRPQQGDPTEQYVNSLFPQTNDDEGSVNERGHQSNDEDDE